MFYNDARQFFGWPDRAHVFNPKGAGTRVYAELVKRKIGAELLRQFPNLMVNTGILTADPNSDSTATPIAVVCEFTTIASDEALKLAHKLAWNFSRTALLITLEPHRLMAWSCWLDPQQKEESPQVNELRDLPKAPGTAPNPLQAATRDLLHWVSLITGDYLKQQPKKFRSDGRADKLLLENLKVVRSELLCLGLERGYCHDLLARIIFTQFLFHRKDSDGRPLMDEVLLKGRCQGTLKSDAHRSLETILADGDETYRLFRWLDEHFNGDLFPGKENQSNVEREAAWCSEKGAVTKNPAVLRLLKDFVSGSLRLKNRQLTLWPIYSFDTIPLEFISSIYEEFLTEDRHKAKAYYTPPHLVDFVLDGVLPWNDDHYDLKILDPACGSGIFLVKAFQRLIHRWRRVHKREPLVSDLKPLLASCLWGVDRDPEAVRVACFSLYLAMADAIEPKYYLKREKVFPHLRGIRLLARDFFDEETDGIRTAEATGQSHPEQPQFDLVIGNAPWGDRSIKETSDPTGTTPTLEAKSVRKPVRRRTQPTKAEKWAGVHGWPVANYDIGPMFLAKGATLVKKDGRVAMVQPASTLLYQRAGNAKLLRQRLFSMFTFDEVANLSAIRFELFPEAVGPACVVSFGVTKPIPNEQFMYFYPKPLRDAQAGERFIVEAQDVNQITHGEAENDPLVWVTLAVGGRRDLDLVRRLSRLPTLARLHKEGKILKREGIIRGNLGREEPQIIGKHFLAGQLPPNTFVELDANSLPLVNDCRVDADASSNFEAFKLPQLIVKQTWSMKEGRFRAALVNSSDPEWGVICTQSYLSIRDLDSGGPHIKAAWLAYNSLLAAYFMTATSSRVGHYRQEGLVKELLNVPLPPHTTEALNRVHSQEEVDALVREAIHLTEAEWVLVEDFVKFVIPEAVQTKVSEGRESTLRAQENTNEISGIFEYVRFFVDVLKASFGKDKAVCATVFEEMENERLPVRLAAVHLDWPGRKPLTVETMDKNGLFGKLRALYESALSSNSCSLSGNGLGFQRVVFLLHSHIEQGRRIPSLYIIKPDQRRYWTRSLAMRDADQLSAAILLANHRSRGKA